MNRHLAFPDFSEKMWRGSPKILIVSRFLPYRRISDKTFLMVYFKLFFRNVVLSISELVVDEGSNLNLVCEDRLSDDFRGNRS